MNSGPINRYQLVCPVCGTQFDPNLPQSYCLACNSPIQVQYNLSTLKQTLKQETILNRPRGIWRWRELLPVNYESNFLTLGEGNTPMLQMKNIGKSLGMKQLYLKDESTNATGTFKARGMAVALSKAMELGLKDFVIATAGNAGGALAAYAARAGLTSHVYMPIDTPIANKTEVRRMGADLHLVNGLLIEAGRQAHADAEASGWFDLSTFKEPFRVEGKKTLGFELAQAFNWVLPDVILFPTGGGTGLVGMWKVFSELETLGWINAKRPRMVAVQAEECAPIEKAMRENAERIEAWPRVNTLAAGLRVPAPFADRLILKTIRDSHGTALAIPDAAILEAQKELASREGVFACPEGAAALAGLKELVKQGWIRKNECVLLFNTGTGLKYI
jgi:threonine synthase